MVLKFGFQVLDDLLLTCERAILILFPQFFDFSQISHFAILNAPPILRNKLTN